MVTKFKLFKSSVDSFCFLLVAEAPMSIKLLDYNDYSKIFFHPTQARMNMKKYK